MKMSPFDRGKTLLPGIAESWEVSDDGLLITFKIRPNVKFHDGSTLTVDDVVASWTRIHAPKGDEISYRKDWFSRIKEVKAVDQSTVEFSFTEPSAKILNFMASDWNSIFPAKVLAEHNNDLKTFIEHPAAGPWKFDEIKAGELIRYVKFEDYWNEGLPYGDALELHILGKGGFAAFLVGQLDTLQVNNPEDYAVALDKGIEGYRAVVPDTHSIFINTKEKPFDDVRVRKAMDLAIDRVGMEIALAPVAVPGKGRWAPAGSAWALTQSELNAHPIFAQDMDTKIAQAKALLTEAGYPDGFSAKFTVGSPSVIQAHGEFVQAMLLQNLNIKLDLEVLDWSVWIARAREQQFVITSGAAFTTLHDPSDFLNAFWKTGGAQNWGGWSNAEFDAIMAKVDTEMDTTKRRKLVYQAYDVLEDEMPTLVGGWRVDGHMWWPYLKGFPVRGPELGRYVYFDRQTLWLDK
jgi:peptide/nickel transport system substrate-binding protein